MKDRFPWWVRIMAKVVLSRLPVNYGTWQRMGLFRHGHMDEGKYAVRVITSHITKCGRSVEWVKGRTILEMGPGDSVSTALIVHALGGRAILIDAGRFATSALPTYVPLYRALQSMGLRPLNPEDFGSLDAMIDACGARYLTSGGRSWRELESDSVDLIFSQAVLEHVALAEFDVIIADSFRVMRQHAIASHRVDLKDHLGGDLNNLRFSDKIWESEFFRRSGFYTNRIQMEEMLRRFTVGGFEIMQLSEQRWASLPTRKAAMAKRFRDIPNNILNVSGFDLLVQKP